jgi:NADPH:quinone reductase-like Zn-dependent oxidoreductase
MKAFYQTSYNGPDASKYGDLPDPVFGKNELLVQVKTISINPLDYKIKNGSLKMIVGSKFPKIVGSDFAGIVKRVGSDVKNFNEGDRVYGAVPIFFRKPGALAELLAIEPKYTRLMPGTMTFEEAAALPVAALTALNGLRKCKISLGKSLLVNGATGGVGHYALQIAKAKGSYVTATCSQANSDLAKNLGADEITGYSKDDLAKNRNKYDAIFDAFGKMKYDDVCRLLKKNGVYASTLFLPGSAMASIFIQIIFRKKLTSSNLRSKPEDFAEIEKLIKEKKLKPLIENTFTLENAAKAFDLAENGRPRGKIIITA